MSEYKKNSHFSGSKPRFGGKPSFQSREPREMYDAECASCHTRCQVPFRPNGKKPVYCTNCFSKTEEGAGRTPSFGAPRSNNFSHDRDARPRPEFREQRFEARPDTQSQDRQFQDLKKELSIMNATLQGLVVAVKAMSKPETVTPATEPTVSTPASTQKKVAAKKTGAKVAKPSSTKATEGRGKVAKKTSKK